MTTDELCDAIAVRLDGIRRDLLGNDFKLTLIARNVTDDNQVFIVSADDEATIGETLARLSPQALAAIRQYILETEGAG